MTTLAPIPYPDYLARKSGVRTVQDGIHIAIGELSEVLFGFQKRGVQRALEMGRAALFLDTGLGKTVCQCEWARCIATHIHTTGDREPRILFVAPLAVAAQTIAEAKSRLGMDIVYSRDGTAATPYTITNYEMIGEFAGQHFDAVVLDESSILKNFTGKTKRQLCEQFAGTRYKLAATATPAPNDLMEIGNHSDFLEVMRSTEMLARWFINDAASVGTYRLKGHAKKDFWQWVSTWAVCASKPSDLGRKFADDDARYQLPKLREEVVLIEDPDTSSVDTGELFDTGTVNISNLNKIKRRTLEARVKEISDLVNSPDFATEPFVIWCETNEESRAIAQAIPGAKEVTGSMSLESKKMTLESFSNQELRVLVSKSSICGFGMNWQHCRNVIFASINFSFEKYYQAVRRFWRFGQDREVHVRVLLSRQESNVWNTILRKARTNEEMKTMMAEVAHHGLPQHSQNSKAYESQTIALPNWIGAGDTNS